MKRVSGRRIDLYPYGLVAPILITLTAIVFIPIVHAGYTSFFRFSLGDEMEFVGFRNYSRMLSDPIFWNSVWRTLVFTISSLLFQYLIGLGFALLMSKGFKWQRLWIALLISPAAVSSVVATVIWGYMLGFDGVINFMLSRAGIEPIRWLSSSRFAFISVTTVTVWKFYPEIMLILYASLVSMPQELFDAAEVDGATGWQRFLSITYPLLLPSTLVALSFRMIFTFREFAIPWLLTEGGPTRATNFLAVHMYRTAFVHWNSGAGSAIAWGIMFLTLALSIIYLRLMYRRMFIN